ncbi:Transposable element Tcb1 transposase [Araneus ventricosus]|uniref:Transposable element Tcb1 transposase n=1 Tax=Araneus ventricosus TaxID=182803 RepID=A0A4Y2URE3_ARAVE|nr:Transposable element Tcb1 transposase [Araneus ventricosus]
MARGRATDLALRNKIKQQHQNGISQLQIGRTFRLAQSTVCTIIKRFTTTGNSRPGKSPGRKLTLADRENKRRRVSWAKSYLSWTPFQWEKVLWIDESIFEVSYGNIGRKVIRKKYEANDPSCYKGVVHKASSMIVWGCLAANVIGNLHFCTGTIKAPDSIRVLDVNLRPSVHRLFGRKRYLFQQDNPRPHRAKITRTKYVPVLEWPAASPDLSPIENIWRILKRNMAQRRPRNIQQLQDYLRQEWEKISTDTLNRLVSFMPERLAAVIRRKGDVISW